MDTSPIFRPLDEEYCDRVTLPSQIFSEPTCPKSIGGLLHKRENAHKSFLTFIKANYRKINTQISQELWLESENLKIMLAEMKDQNEENLNETIRNRQGELHKLDSDVFDILKKAFKKYEAERFAVVDRFHQNLQNLERRRSDSFKKILNECYTNMHRIAFVLPRQLLEYFEQEIMRINQITLNNYHYYSKVCTDLKLQTEDYIRMLLLELMDFEEKYRIAVKKVKVRGLIDVKYLVHNDFYDDVTARSKESVLIMKKISDKADSSSFHGDFPSSTNDLEMWSRQMQMTLDVLDSNAKQLISLYRMAVVNIFNRFFDELQKITDLLLEETKTPEAHDIQYINSEIYKPVIDEITQHYACGVADLQELWNSIASYMQSNIRNTYLFLQGSAHLWDGHFRRVEDAQNLVLRDLKKCIHKNDRAAQVLEKKINSAVDKLRQESTVTKLNQQLQETNKIFDSIEKLMCNQCEAEIRILQKYHGVVDQLIDVLLSEIERFLGEFSQNDSIRDNRGLNKNNNNASNDDLINNLMPHQMRTCKFQVDAVNNWMFGLWEAIRLYTTTCRKELTDQANLWVNSQITKLRKREEVRMVVIKPWYVRTKTMIYEVRLKEIEDHHHRIEKLEETIDRYITGARDFNHNCKRHHRAILDNCEMKVKEIEDKAKEAKKSQQVASCIGQATAVIEEVRHKLEESIQENEEMVDDNSKKINRTMCHVVNSIKMFSEGGDYSRDEVKKTTKKLNKLKKLVPKKYAKVSAEFHDIKAEMSQKLEAIKTETIRRLDHSKEEFEHNEKIVLKIKELQNEIRRRVHVVKFRINRVEACINYFATMSRCNLWRWKNFQIMRNALVESLQKISELSNFLIYNKNRDQSEILIKSDGTTHLSELYQLIQNSFQQVQNVAKEFYEGHGAIVNRGKIQPDYQAFVGEVARCYDSFKKQVEIHCLECAEELIRHVLKLLKTNDEVYSGLMKKCPMLKSGANYEEFCKNLKSEYEDLQRKRLVLDKNMTKGSSGRKMSNMSGNYRKTSSRISFDAASIMKECENVDIRDVILNNTERVAVLHVLITRLLNHVKDKLDVAERLLKTAEESEEDVEEPRPKIIETDN